MSYNIKQQIRTDTPQVGYAPYRQVHAHSTGNTGSTAQNEADYMSRKELNTGFYTHVVGNGQVIQVAPVNRGAWDVGGGYNYETYAAVELIESHGSKEEFMRDYKIYCELLFDLAKQAGIPTTLDTGDLSGIKTHNYCTNNQPNNGSDHVDPIPYLTKWGITQQQFAKDILNCKGSNSSSNNNSDYINKGDLEMNILYKVAGYNTESGYQLVNTVTGIRKTLTKVEYQTWKDAMNGKQLTKGQGDNLLDLVRHMAGKKK